MSSLCKSRTVAASVIYGANAALAADLSSVAAKRACTDLNALIISASAIGLPRAVLSRKQHNLPV